MGSVNCYLMVVSIGYGENIGGFAFAGVNDVQKNSLLQIWRVLKQRPGN